MVVVVVGQQLGYGCGMCVCWMVVARWTGKDRLGKTDVFKELKLCLLVRKDVGVDRDGQ